MPKTPPWVCNLFQFLSLLCISIPLVLPSPFPTLKLWSKIPSKEIPLLFGCSFKGIKMALKAMVPHSSTLALKIPWTEKPGALQSMGSLRVGHDWVTSLSLFTFMHWRRKWWPTPVFLPGGSQGRGSLVGCCLYGCTESNTTKAT